MAFYRNGENTRNIIVRTAGRLFWDKGYTATTFEDICLLAHVNRSTVNYHFKTKDEILWQCRNYTTEKTIIAATYYCKDPSYIYILGKSIYWYYILYDPTFFTMATEYAKLEFRKAAKSQDRFDSYLACFLPALEKLHLKPPGPLFLTEVSLRALEYAPLLLGEKIEEETLDELMENFVKMVGRICGLPDHVSQLAWTEIFFRMENIPYDTMNLHWP